MDTKILLIDDDVRILQTFARTLKLASYTVFTAEGGEQGLTLYHQENPDIVLLDLRMPGMDGLEVLRTIRAHDPEANVILSTGHGDKDAVIEALRAGASDFLSKPIDQVSLESALRRAEERIHLKRELRASQEALREQNEQLEEMVKARTAELEREIEEHQRAEDQLRFQAHLLDAVEQAVIVTDLDGHVVYWNPFAEQLYGWSAEEAMGKTTIELIASKQSQQYAAEIMACLQRGESWSGEYMSRRQDGTVFPVSVTCTLIQNALGELTHIIGISMDITKRKQEEQALKDSHEKLTLLFDILPVGISVLDNECRIVEQNRTLGQVLALSEAELLGGDYRKREYLRTDGTLMPVEELPSTRVLKGEPEVLHTEIGVVKEDGELIWTDVSAVRCSLANWQVVILTTDITERKRAEEAQKRHAAELKALNAMTMIVNQSMEVDEIFNRTMDEVLRLVGVEAAAMMVFEETSGELVMAAHRGVSDDFVRYFSCMKPGEGLSGRVAQTGEPAVLRDLTEYPEIGRAYLEQERIQSAVSVPMLGSTGLIGVMTLGASRREHFDEKGLDLLVGLGRQIAAGLEKARLYETARENAALLDVTGQMAKVGGWEYDVQASELRWSDQTRRIHQVPMDYQPSLDDALAFFPPGDREKLVDAFQAAIEVGTPYDLELRFVTAQGEKLWVRTICQPQVVDGTTRKLKGTFQDITDRREAEEALRRSEERFRMTVLRSPIGVGMVDHTGKLTDCNAVLAKMVGYSREELLKLNFADFTHPDDLEREWELINKLWGGETPEYRMEKRYIHKDGHTIWVDAAASLFKDDEGELAFGFAFVQDITERKRAEEALRESEHTFRSYIENAPYGVFVTDEEGRYVEVNEAACRSTGYDRDELLSMRIVEFAPPDRVDVAETHFQAVVEDGFSAGEVEYITKEGERRWWSIIAVRLSETRFLGYTDDITERKEAEQALRESEQKFRLIAESSAEDIWQLDLDGHVTYVSPAVERIFGYTPEEALQLGFDAFFLESDLERASEAFITAMSGQEHQLLEFDGKRKDGSLVPIEVSVSPIIQDNAIIGVQGIARDVTERKEAEDVLRRTTERLRILREIDTAILAAHSSEEIARATLVRLNNLIPCRRASITEIDATRRRGRDLIVLLDGEQEMIGLNWYPLSNAGKLIDAIQRGSVYHVEDIAALEAKSSLEESLEATGIRSYVSVPLLVQDVPRGSLNLASEIPDFFQPDHIEILEEIAASLAVALQQAQLLEQTQEDAETKTLLLREVNHRVLNNLTAIMAILDMEKRRPLDNAADLRTALDDVVHRIGGMTTVHRMLSSAQWQPLDLKEVVERVIHAALSGSPIRRQIEVVVDAPDEPLRLTSKQSVSIALVVNELTTNSVKYAFRDRSHGRIDVEIVPLDEQKVQFTFRDDGDGLPAEVLAGEQRNVGLWLVETNVRHTLGGEVSYQNDEGAVVTFTVERTLLN